MIETFTAPCPRLHWPVATASSAGCRCHCSGAMRMSSSKRRASSWVIRVTSSRRRPSRSTGSGGPIRRGAARRGGSTRRRAPAAPRSAGRASPGPAGQRGALAEELDLDAVAGEVAIGQQAHDAGSPCSARSTALPAVGPERHDLHADRGAHAGEPLEAAPAARPARPRPWARGPGRRATRPRSPSRRGAGGRGSRPCPGPRAARCAPTRSPGSAGSTAARRRVGSRNSSSQ